MTYGSLRLQLKKLAPAIDQEIIDGWIQDRYTEILDRLPWKRLEAESTIAAPDSYTIGTLTATQGSTAITGLGTTWTAAMTGLMIRIANGQEYYQFTYVSATTGTLDRNYEGATGSITGEAIGSGGAGYTAGDGYAVVGGNGMAQGTVGSIGAGGVATSLIPGSPGAGYSVANGVATTTGGAGAGLTINITAVSPGAGLTYRIDQNIFLLPSDARILRSVRPLHGGKPLEMITPGELDRRAPTRGAWAGSYGEPAMAAPTWDNFSDPPNLQVELYPVPSSPDSSGIRKSWVLDYIFDPATPSATGTSILPWVRPTALKAGVEADIKRHMDQLSSAEAFDKRFEQLVLIMAQNNALQRGAQTIRLAPELRRRHMLRYHRQVREQDI